MTDDPAPAPAPLLVSAATAARLCGVSKSTWWALCQTVPPKRGTSMRAAAGRAAATPLAARQQRRVDPSAVLRQTIGVRCVCATCGHLTYQQEGKRHPDCDSCRRAPLTNVTCRRCGHTFHAPDSTPSAVSACYRCLRPARESRLAPNAGRTPRLASAAGQCADYREGGCLTAPADDRRCLVAWGTPCATFETCVIPVLEGAALEAVRFAYSRDRSVAQVAEAVASVRRCPECKAGMLRGRRLCDICRSRHRRDSYRKARAARNVLRATVEA
jgi:hypothetical protein